MKSHKHSTRRQKLSFIKNYSTCKGHIKCYIKRKTYLSLSRKNVEKKVTRSPFSHNAFKRLLPR